MFEKLWNIIDDGFCLTISKPRADCYEIEYSKQMAVDGFFEGVVQAGTLAEAVAGVVKETEGEA